MVANGWKLYVHPLFHDQIVRLKEQVDELAKKSPSSDKEEPATKLLATIDCYIW